MKLYSEKLTPEDEWAFEEIRKHARAILRFIEEPDDVIGGESAIGGTRSLSLGRLEPYRGQMT